MNYNRKLKYKYNNHTGGSNHKKFTNKDDIPKKGSQISVFSIFGKNKNHNLSEDGDCKWIRSDEQPIFGPYLWTAFHIIAVNYPDEPTQQQQKGIIHFVKSVPWIIPCGNCGWHFDQYLHHDYMPELNNNMPEKYNHITSSKDRLIEFFCHAHNNVTNYTNKSAKLWNHNESKEYYKYGYRCVPKEIIPWEGPALKKAENVKCKIYYNEETKQCKYWTTPVPTRKRNY